MSLWVLLLRGVNVGGRGKLPMADLRAQMEALGAQAPQTYIQSGNAVFSGEIAPERFAGALTEAIGAAHGHRPRALVLPAREMAETLATFPFPEALDDPKSGHVWFCAAPPAAADLAALAALAGPDERFALDGRRLCLHAPAGIGRSALAAGAEKALGVPATARNLRTIAAIADLAAARLTQDGA